MEGPTWKDKMNLSWEFEVCSRASFTFLELRYAKRALKVHILNILGSID